MVNCFLPCSLVFRKLSLTSCRSSIDWCTYVIHAIVQSRYTLSSKSQRRLHLPCSMPGVTAERAISRNCHLQNQGMHQFPGCQRGLHGCGASWVYNLSKGRYEKSLICTHTHSVHGFLYATSQSVVYMSTLSVSLSLCLCL